MDYEKKYKEAMERARQFFEKPYLEDSAGIVGYIFPELKEEGEDEKIRKEITELVMLPTWKTETEFYRRKELVAWLEKQGEQKKVFKSDEMTTLEDKLSSLVVDAVHIYCKENELDTPHCVGLILGDRLAKEWSQDILTLAKDELKMTEQKPAWSEEDEENLNWFEKFFRAESVIAEGKDIPQDRYLWFKNLKDRVQPKQEWSEDDEKKLQNILECLRNGWKKLPTDILKYESWIKSLRPQSQWKPSNEQMDALNDVISSRDIKYDVLSELWKDLKKLREE